MSDLLRELAWFIFPDRGLTDSEHFLAERKEGKAGAATRSELGRHIGSFAAREVYQNNSTMPWVCQHLTHLIWPVRPRSLFHGFLGPFFGACSQSRPRRRSCAAPPSGRQRSRREAAPAARSACRRASG